MSSTGKINFWETNNYENLVQSFNQGKTNWYKSHKQSGNQLTDFKTLFEFIAPYSKKMFITIELIYLFLVKTITFI